MGLGGLSGYSDAAHRCSDTIRMHIVAGMATRWAAIRLSDGGSDGIAYDTRADAVRHQLHEQLCAYVFIPHDDMSPKAAETFLSVNRKLYDAGMRLIDPETEIHAPQQTLDQLIIKRGFSR